MSTRGLFANGVGVELASAVLVDGVVFRLGRATDSHHRVGKGELFVEFYRKDEFVLGGPLRPRPQLKGEFAAHSDHVRSHVVYWGLSGTPAERSDREGDLASRFTIVVPEGVVWLELRTA
jgi:hypothetical protein